MINNKSQLKRVFGLFSITLILILSLIFLNFVLAETPDNPQDSFGTLNITSEGKQWNVIKSTGTESNLIFWTANAKDKKTELGWIPESGSCFGLIDKNLYDENNNLILDDKDKEIVLKCESSKCDGKNCYHISLTDAQATNINEYVKLGSDSIVSVYQDINTLNYNLEWAEVNISLFKNISNTWNSTVNDIWVFEYNDSKKFGAEDILNEYLENYKYQIESTRPIIQNNWIPYIKNPTKIKTGTFPAFYHTETHEFDFNDICSRGFECHNETKFGENISVCNISAGCEFNFYNSTIGNITNYFLEVTFLSDKFIDPSITIGEDEVVTDALLDDVIAEANFTHLNISTSAPYDSLVLYMPFDGDAEDTTGFTAYDWSGKGNDGTGYGTVIVNSTGCLYDDCAKGFNGQDNWIIVPDSASLDSSTGAGQPRTWGYWIKVTTITDNKLITDKSDFSAISLWSELHTSTTTGSITGGVAIGNSLNTGTDSISANIWYHVVFTYNGTDTRLYLDGSLVDGPQAQTASADNDLVLQIGGRPGTQTITGLMDEVMVFNVSLTAQQITDIYNNQSARFVKEGTQELNNQSYLNISSGNNRVNVTTTLENNLGSKVNLSIDYYDGSWSSTSPQTITSGVNYTYTISSTSTNLTLNYTLIAGNSTNPFYSPIIKGDIILDVYSVGVDNEYPTFSSYWDDNASLIDAGAGHFNVTVTSTNGTVILHINGTDIVATNLSADIYNASHTFTNSGTYLYNWTAYGNGSSHNLNTSANRYYTVNSSVDTEYPVFSNFLFSVTNNTEYVENRNYQFNTTITSTNGTAGIDFDSTNYSLSNISDSFYKTLSNLAAGTYGYYWWAFGNGTSTNFNNTQTYSYTVAVNSSLVLGLTATTPITYGTTTDFAGSGCPSQLSCSLNISNQVYGAGTISANYSTAGNVNYSSTSTIFTVTINQAVPQGDLTNTTGWTITYPTEATIGLSESQTGDADVTYKVYRDGIDLGTGETATLGVGVYSYVLNSTGGTNYTANISMDSFTITVNQNSTYLINITGTTPITYGTAGDFTGTRCPSQLTCYLYRNNTAGAITSPDTDTLSAGNYNYTFNTTGNTNYSVNTASKILVVSKVASSINLTLNNTQGNVTITQGDSIDLNCSTITGDSGATLKLYRESSLINSGTSPIGNTTTFNTIQIENITCVYEATTNYTSVSETWWVNVTTPLDTTPPNVTSLTETPSEPIEYTPNQVYEFNATVIDETGISVVLLEFNGINYTATNLTANVYNVTIPNLGTGNYTYRWFANDTLGYINNTKTGSYNITINSSYVLSITGTTPITYGTGGDFEGLGCPPQLICNLYRNDTTGTVSNPDTTILGVASYNYTFNTTGNTNYTSSSTSNVLVINQATPSLTFLANGGTSNLTLVYPQQVNMSATASAGTVGLEKDSVDYLFNNHLNITLGVGTYIFRANITGNVNYTSVDYTNYNITINKSQDSCNLIFNETTVTYPNTFRVYSNCTSVFTLRRNGTIISNNSIQRLSAGTFNFTVSRTDSLNYTNTKEQENFIVSKGTSILNLTLDNGARNITINQGSTIPLNCSTINGDTNTVLNLYRNSTLINSGVSPLGNNTEFNSVLVENITCSYEASQNYTVSYKSWWVNVSAVDTTAPIINLASPKNITYNSNTININVSANEIISAWWWTNDSGTTNTTFTPNITITWGEGSTTLTVYANDSSNNIGKNTTTFYVDTISPTINITFPLNTTYSVDVNTLNYTSNGDYCWYSINNGVINSSVVSSGTNFTGVTSTENSNTWIVWCNDTLNNLGFDNVTFFKDTEPPYFIGLTNQTLDNHTALSYDINAGDAGIGLSGFSIDDTTNFSIVFATGVLTNATQLQVNVYTINITINDTLGNTNSSNLIINVTAPSVEEEAIIPKKLQIWRNKSSQNNVSWVDVEGDWKMNDVNMSNLTITDKITFKLGELIDNLVDGWLRITGGLKVEGDINITGQQIIGTSTTPQNITMYSSDGSDWNCGVNNAGVFNCG